MINKLPSDEAAQPAAGAGPMPEHYGNALDEYWAAVRGAAVFDQSSRGKVELAGADALGFLHNLCTNDIRKLAVGTGCEAYLTTAKARLIAPLVVSRLHQANGNTLLLDTAPGLAAAVCQHLGRYRISEDAAITDRTGALALLHLCGPESPKVVAALTDNAADDLAALQHREATVDGATVFLRRHDLLNLPGFDFIMPAADAAKVAALLHKHGARPAGSTAFDLLRVEAGLPAYGAELDAERLVMEVGRTAQTISFGKGCYLGQESIVMARDRGHVNRQLVGLRLAGGQPVAAGAKVWQDGAEVGQVTSSVASPRLGQAIALAYLKRGSQEPGTAVQIDAGAEKRGATVAALPF